MSATGEGMRQRGWLGLVGILVALVIVALLAQTVLKSYRLIGGGDRVAAHRPSDARPGADDAAQPHPAAANPIERARGLEQQLQRDAHELNRRIDEQTR